MKTSEAFSKCLECGFVELSKNFSVSIGSQTHVRMCPHCRASGSNLMDDLRHYVMRSITSGARSIRYTVINNKFGHFAVADRMSGTRLTTWASHVHVINEFCATERKVKLLSGELEARDHTLQADIKRIGERRCVPRAGTDRRLFNLPLPGRPLPSRADQVARP